MVYFVSTWLGYGIFGQLLLRVFSWVFVLDEIDIYLANWINHFDLPNVG